MDFIEISLCISRREPVRNKVIKQRLVIEGDIIVDIGTHLEAINEMLATYQHHSTKLILLTTTHFYGYNTVSTYIRRFPLNHFYSFVNSHKHTMDVKFLLRIEVSFCKPLDRSLMKFCFGNTNVNI